MELKKDNEKEEEIIEEVEVPEIRNLNLKEAKKILKEMGLEITLKVELEKDIKEEEVMIKDQLPKPRN